ncbi:MAG: 50S ribosomal protein L6 [Candidatus Margulisiibacteriota bacterium]
MSKLARKPIDTSSLDVSFTNNILGIKGKNGELSLSINSNVKLTIEENSIQVASDNKAILGLHCALIKNMVTGIKDKFSETLTLKGVGYRATLAGSKINFNLGYSHPVEFQLPDGVSAELASPTEIKLSGIDKQQVGQVAADIIKLRPAKKDPYKEKGIKRIQDRIIKKVGKKVK